MTWEGGAHDDDVDRSTDHETTGRGGRAGEGGVSRLSLARLLAPPRARPSLDDDDDEVDGDDDEDEVDEDEDSMI